MWKRIASILMCSVLLLQFTACGKGKGQGTSGKPVEISGVSVWSAPSTVRVEQTDIKYKNRGAAELTYNAVRNEYENQQLFLTASETIDSYYLKVSDLKSGDHTLGKDNITVYNERFSLVTGDSFYEDGWWPDALIPIDAAKEYDELSIGADKNAALWISVYVPKDTPAGLYQGTFQLTVEKGTLDIPVSVQVNDYTLPDETTARTMFRWLYDRIGPGEMDASVEMMECYYEFFLDYHISLIGFPVENLTGEELINSLDKYWDAITTYTFTRAAGLDGLGLTDGTTYVARFREQVLAVAAASSPEKNLFEKAMLYVIDEPNLEKYDANVERLLGIYENCNTLLKQFADEIAADTTGTYDEFKKIKGWREVITGIPNTIPTHQLEWLIRNESNELAQRYLNMTNSLTLDWRWFTDEYTKVLEEWAEKYGLTYWWYNVNTSKAPIANYHIAHSNLLSARTISWLQSKYDIVDGNLYYSAASYVEHGDDYDNYVDIYNYPSKSTVLTAGDGVLTYPGAAYGIYGPLPSLRLMSIRDGMEEYELLQEVKKGYESLTSNKKSTLSAQDFMEQFYSPLYANTLYVYEDGEEGLDFDGLRETLIKTVILNQKGIQYGIYFDEPQNNSMTLSCLISDGNKVYINGELMENNSNGVISCKIKQEEISKVQVRVEATNGEQTDFTYAIKSFEVVLNALSDASALQNIAVDEASKAQLVQSSDCSTDGTSVKLNVNGVITGDVLTDIAHQPTVKMSTKLLGDTYKLSDLSYLTMDIYSDEAFSFTVRIYNGEKYVDVSTCSLVKGKNKIHIRLDAEEYPEIEKADTLAFVFQNTGKEETASHYELYIDNIVGSVWRGGE